MIGNLKSKLMGSINRFSGNSDFLEGVCASSALIAAADGTIDDEEVQAALDAVKTNPTLNGCFKARVIEKKMSEALDRTRTRPGRLALFKKLEDVTEEQAEIVYLAALDVADADGNIDPAEKTMLTKIAGKLRVDEASLDV